MKAAGWDSADPITLQSSLRIAIDSVLRRPDDDVPSKHSSSTVANRTSPSSYRLETVRASASAFAFGNVTVRGRASGLGGFGHLRRAGRAESYQRPDHSPHRLQRGCRAGPHYVWLEKRRLCAGGLLQGRFPSKSRRPQWWRGFLENRRTSRCYCSSSGSSENPVS